MRLVTSLVIWDPDRTTYKGNKFIIRGQLLLEVQSGNTEPVENSGDKTRAEMGDSGRARVSARTCSFSDITTRCLSLLLRFSSAVGVLNEGLSAFPDNSYSINTFVRHPPEREILETGSSQEWCVHSLEDLQRRMKNISLCSPREECSPCWPPGIRAALRAVASSFPACSAGFLRRCPRCPCAAGCAQPTSASSEAHARVASATPDI